MAFCDFFSLFFPEVVIFTSRCHFLWSAGGEGTQCFVCAWQNTVELCWHFESIQSHSRINSSETKQRSNYLKCAAVVQPRPRWLLRPTSGMYVSICIVHFIRDKWHDRTGKTSVSHVILWYLTPETFFLESWWILMWRNVDVGNISNPNFSNLM